MAGENTRERLLNAAEMLFAARGFDNVGLREIATEAGDPVSSITYHFGSRDRLIESVIGRRFTPINDKRLELLQQAEQKAGNKGASLPAILDAFIRPPFNGRNQDIATMLPILANCFMTMQHITEDLRTEFRVMLCAFLPRMRKLCPKLTDEEFVWRFHFIIGMLIRCLQSLHQAGGTLPNQSERAAVVRQLVQCSHAMLRAAHVTDGIPAIVNPLQMLTLKIIQEAAPSHGEHTDG